MEVPHQIPKIIHYCWFGKTSLRRMRSAALPVGKSFALIMRLWNGMKRRSIFPPCLSMSNRHMQHKSGHLLQTMYAFML